MKRYKTASVIDTDSRRRAARLNALKGSRFHVEPYESVSEFAEQGNAASLILIHDQGSAIADLLAMMRAQDYWSPIIAYGEMANPVRCSQVILQGLIGYLPDAFDRADLDNLLDGAADEISAIIDLRFGAADARQKLKSLTKREAEVLDRLQSGLTNREIADTLDISPRTVEVHRANMLRKMATKSAHTAISMSVHAKIGH